MRKLKKYLAIGCTAMMVLTAAGCSSTTTSSEAVEESTQDTATTETAQDTTTTDATTTTTDTTTATDTTQTADASIVFGKVTAINGTSITLALGTISQGKDMGSGEAPTNIDNTTTKSGTSSSTTETTPAAPPSGEVPSGDAQGAGGQAPSGEAPSGEAPSADGQAPDMSAMFEESGETLTITVEDESLIKIVSGSETTTGSLSDIAVDTILNIEYDDSDNITSITIQSAGK